MHFAGVECAVLISVEGSAKVDLRSAELRLKELAFFSSVVLVWLKYCIS